MGKTVGEWPLVGEGLDPGWRQGRAAQLAQVEIQAEVYVGDARFDLDICSDVCIEINVEARLESSGDGEFEKHGVLRI